VRETADGWSVAGSDFALTFDRHTGTLGQWLYQGTPLLTRGPAFQAWRAPTDNDGTRRRHPGMAVYKWDQEGLDRLQTRIAEVAVHQPDAAVLAIDVRTVHGARSLRPAFHVDTRYLIYGSGDVLVQAHIRPRANLPHLPRLGLRLGLPGGFNQFAWFGRGPHESHIDRQVSAWVDLFRGTVAEQYVPYIYPQENGNKTDVRWAAVTDARGLGLLAVAQPLMEASVHHFTAEDFTRANHTHELAPRNETILNLDYRQGGLGSNSCGPEPLPQYQLKPEPVTFTVRLRPFAAELTDPMTLSRQAPAGV
jgi:hypothetical protein